MAVAVGEAEGPGAAPAPRDAGEKASSGPPPLNDEDALQARLNNLRR